MKKNLKTIATSLTSLVFLVVGTSGVFLYFHLFERSVKELHEVIGLLFVAAAVFHVIFNFNAMKNYFTKKIFIIASLVIVAISLSFIIPNSTDTTPNPKKYIITSVLNAPIENAIEILGGDMDQLERLLKKESLLFNDEATIRQLAKSNAISPFKLVTMISKKID
jgi:hypothetical protein